MKYDYSSGKATVFKVPVLYQTSVEVQTELLKGSSYSKMFPVNYLICIYGLK